MPLKDKAGLEALLVGSLFKPSKFDQEEENLQKWYHALQTFLTM
jgi:hypothetical protein